MAVSTTLTGLSIDEWAAILGISPWEINGFLFPATKSAKCKSVFQKFQWQSDHLSTSEISDAIADAEAMIAAECLFWPYPKFSIDEIIQYPRPHQRQLRGFAGDIRGDWKTFSTKNH